MQAPQTRGSSGFDAALTDVFQVQADIAGQVAQALNVALGDSAKHELAARPTQSLPAYDAFLRGEAASQGMSAGRPAESPPGDCGVRAGGGARFDLCPGLGPARPGAAQSCTSVARPPRPGPRRPAMRPSGRWRWPPRGPRVTRPLARITVMCSARSPARTPKTAPRSPWLPAMPSSSELWGSTNSTSAAGRRRAGTWSRLPGSIPAQAQPPTSSGSCCSTPASTPRPSGSSITRSSSCRRICVREDRATVALAQGDLAGAQAVSDAAPKEVDPTALVAFVATY